MNARPRVVGCEAGLPRRLAVAGLALTALAVIGCGSRDEALRVRVDAALAADDSVGSIRFRLDTDGETVTLSGTVSHPAYRRRAVAIAKSTTGVSDVIDRIVVVAPVAPVDSTTAPAGAQPSARRSRMGHM